MKTPYSQTTPTQQASVAGLQVYGLKQDEGNFLVWIIASLGLHAGLIIATWLIIVILQFLGWSIPWFKDLAVKERDVEFVLVDNTPPAKPRKPTNLRAEHDTRSGGERIANRPLQVPQTAAGNPGRQATPRPAAKATPQPAARPQPQPRRAAQTPARPVQQAQPKQPTTPQKPAPTPAPPSPKVPKPQQIASASPALPPNPIAPTIKTPAPPNPSVKPGGGPIATTSGSSSSSHSGASGSPGPTTISGSPSRGGGSPGGSGGNPGASGAGGRGAYSQGGSPGGGGGRAGVDAMAEPDFGPYIAELQRRIRRNWSPPVEDKSKRVVAMFKIDRQGKLISLRIQQSSGSPQADQAAMAAVRASAPFRQLPPNYRGNDIDVQFIFDYEIYNGARLR